MDAVKLHGTDAQALMETLPCGLLLLGGELAAEDFNGIARDFFADACALYKGLEFDRLAGALWDMAADGGFGEVELLTDCVRAFEECTVDYRRFDGKVFRVSAKPADHPGFRVSLLISDISDITECERVLAEHNRELAGERGALNSRLKLADALASERETRRLGKQFAARLTKILDSFEDALKNGDSGAILAEIEKQREYADLLVPDTRLDFAERVKKSLRLPENAAPRVTFHHIAPVRCGESLENDIIEAVREGVILVAVCGTAESVGVSLRAHDGGMELNIHSDGPVVPDYENTDTYARLKKIAKRMRAALETDTAGGLDINLRCAFPIKAGLPAALVALSDAGVTRGVCETLGGGAEPMLRCIAAAPDIDLQKACQRYSPSVLIAEPGLIEKHAAALKRVNNKIKVVAISAPGSTASGMARLYLNGYLPRDIEPETLRAAVACVMRGLTVRTDGAALDRAEETARRYGLTEVEQSIIGMTGQGMSSEKIAAALHYSQGSLRNMLSAIYVKLGVSDRAQLTAFAILNGFSDSFMSATGG